MIQIKKIITVCFFIIAFFILTPGPDAALGTTIVPDAPKTVSGEGGEKYKTGDYTLCDIISVFVIASKGTLGVVGSVALLMLIYGGILLIVSGESTLFTSERVNKGKDVIRGSILGLIIVLTSFMIINFAFKLFISNSGGFEKEFGGKWYEIPKCAEPKKTGAETHLS